MARQKNPNRVLAFELYKSNTSLTAKDIAEELSEKIENIRVWKSKDKWDSKLGIKRGRKPGGQKGNKNSVGNNGGAPKGNLHAMKHGMCCDENKRSHSEFLRKWYPVALKNAIEESEQLGLSKLDKMGYAIDILWGRILVSQKIVAVKNKKDMTKELKKSTRGKNPSEEYEIQFAWDKENKALDTQAKALEKLSNMIERYEKLVRANWDLVTEEHKLRVEKLGKEISKISDDDTESIPVVISGANELED